MGKAGRKRKMGAREPNGRISRKGGHRADSSEATKAVAIEARQRVHSLPKGLARDPKAETVIGRWCLRGEVSQEQWEAAERYREDAQAYSRAMNAPSPHPKVVSMDRVRGAEEPETDEDVRRADRARQRWADACVAIVEAEMVEAGASGALALVVLGDQDYPRFVGLVRTALNALARHYRGTGKIAAE